MAVLYRVLGEERGHVPLERDAAQLRDWLAPHPEDRRGPTGTVRQSHRTDTERATMATDTGVIHGYTGVAAVDERAPIIVEAQAHGTGAAQETLLPMATAMTAGLTEDSLSTADAGYPGAATLKALGGPAGRRADRRWRDAPSRRALRDERFATQGRHQEKPDPLHDTSPPPRTLPLYQPSDCRYDADARTGVCPAGTSLYRRGQHVKKGLIAVQCQGAQRDGVPCTHRARCLRTPVTTKTRQVAFVHGRAPAAPTTCTA